MTLPGCGRAPADRYVDVAPAAGLDFRHVTGATGARHLPETVAGGAGWLDYDQDGDLDLYCVNGNERSEGGGPGALTAGGGSRLYRNEGDRRFSDVTEEAGVGHRGYGMGIAVGDYDNDGRPDLYVSSFAPSGEGGNVLYRNEGGGRFRDVTAEAGVAPGGWSTAAAFLDYDGDGLLDLYVARYVRYDPAKRCGRGPVHSYCGPNDFPREPDVLYRQREGGRFEDVSAETGIAFDDEAGGAGLGVIGLDFDLDGDTDIFVANDQGPNYLFENHPRDGGGRRFTDVALGAGVAYGPDGAARAGMGVDAGDVDLDGREDLVVTNFADEPDALFLAEGGGLFRDAAVELGIAGPTLLPLGFGVVLTDHDLDGDLDLYIAEGHVQDAIEKLRPGSGQRFAQESLLLENREGRGFTDISREAGAWFREARVGRAAAAADYDEDGDEDLLVVNAGGRAALLENRAPGRGGWLALRLRGTRANRDGYGARVAVVITGEDGGERTRVFEVRSTRSYASACDPRVRVGLGPGAPRSIRAIVRWPPPAGFVEEYTGIAPGRTTVLAESGEPPPGAVPFPEPRARHPARLPSHSPGEITGAGKSSPENLPEKTAARIEEALRKARDLRAQHRIAEAFSVLESAGGADPASTSHRELRLERAELLFSLYRVEEAERLLQALVREAPSLRRPRALLARALCDLGRHREALAFFESLIVEGAELEGEARRALGRAMVESSRVREGLAQIAGALASDPWLDIAYLDLGRALTRLGLAGKATPFLARYRSGEGARRREQAVLDLEMQGRAAEAQAERGEMELARGRAFRALGAFNRALGLSPGHGPSFLALARLSARLERRSDAIARLSPLAGEPAVAALRDEIEAGMKGAGELARARESIRARMAGRPLGACAPELADLAAALRQGGEPARAREVALFAAELSPRSNEAQRAAAETFDGPGEAFIRLWALERAALLEPLDQALAARRDELARELWVR